MRWRSLASIALALLVAGCSHVDPYNLPAGVTDIAQEVYDLHMLIFWVCVAIGVPLFGIMVWSMLVHRKSLGHKPATFHDHVGVEIAWTVIPFFILIAMAVPAAQTLIKMYDTSQEDLTIEVRGYQWKWEYKYLDDNRDTTVKFFSTLSTPQDEIHNRTEKGEFYLREVDKPLVIPINKKVRFLITANDVIHAWWVPEFGIKRDAIPGIINELWAIAKKPGVYRGQCTELCGKDHGFMPVVVNAVTQEEYDRWFSEKAAEYKEVQQCVSQTWTPEKLMTEGEKVYGTMCASCHQPTGMGLPPAFPALKGSAVALGPKAGHLDIVLHGKSGTTMQAFGTQLDPCSIASVIHYERHAWGNNTNDVTLPQDVLDAKGK